MILHDGIMMESSFDMNGETFSRREDVQPVVLTYDILLLIKGVQPRGYGVLPSIELPTGYILALHESSERGEIRWGVFMNDGCVTIITYLHQLQQIYRSLSLGKELTIELE